MHGPLVTTVLQEKDYHRVPWKNGQGLTTEIFAYPSSEDFLWRLSRAEIKTSGAFSNFGGIDRTIVQLSDSALTLQHGDGRLVPLERLRPYSFDGDWQTEAIVTVPCEDFNVMTQRGEIGAWVECFHGITEKKTLTCLGDVLVLYVVAGLVALELKDELSLQLDPKETLLYPSVKGQEIEVTMDSGSELIVIHLGKDLEKFSSRNGEF